MHIADQASRVLQSWHVDVAQHAVDTFDFKGHMLGQDIGDRSRYGHDGLRTEMGRPVGQPTVITVSYTVPVRRSRSSPAARSPQTKATQGTPSRAGAKPRLEG